MKELKKTITIENNLIITPDGYKAIGINIDGTIKLKKKHREKSWEEFGKLEGYQVNTKSEIISINNITSSKQNRNVYLTKELAEAFIALGQLLCWRDKVNEGWIPDWERRSVKGIISFNNYSNKPNVFTTTTVYGLLMFKDFKTANQFYKDHLILINIAKPLLYY